MRNKLLSSALLFSLLFVFTSFGVEKENSKPYCGPWFDVQNWSLGTTIKTIRLMDMSGTIYFNSSFNLGPGQDYYIGQVSALPDITLRITLDDPADGSIKIIRPGIGTIYCIPTYEGQEMYQYEFYNSYGCAEFYIELSDSPC